MAWNHVSISKPKINPYQFKGPLEYRANLMLMKRDFLATVQRGWYFQSFTLLSIVKHFWNWRKDQEIHGILRYLRNTFHKGYGHIEAINRTPITRVWRHSTNTDMGIIIEMIHCSKPLMNFGSTHLRTIDEHLYTNHGGNNKEIVRTSLSFNNKCAEKSGQIMYT